jgi:hypothetical protein
MSGWRPGANGREVLHDRSVLITGEANKTSRLEPDCPAVRNEKRTVGWRFTGSSATLSLAGSFNAPRLR